MTHALSRLWRRIARRPVPTTSVTLHGDYSAFSEQMTRLSESWQVMKRTIGVSLAPVITNAATALSRLARSLSPYVAANQPVHIAGLEARYFIRAGLDPAYRDPAALDLLVWTILRGQPERTTKPSPRAGHADLLWVTDENRSLVAAAAIRGWVSSYAGAETVRVLAWHRQIGDTRLSVGRAS